MENIKTNIGKIYCKNNPDGSLSKYRIMKIEKDINDKIEYTINELDEYNNLIPEKIYIFSDINDLNEFIKSCDAEIHSMGIVSISNVVAATTPSGEEIKDVIMMFFPNNKMTRIPDINQPYIVARQGLNDFFSDYFGIGSGDKVGLCVSLNNLPTGYSLSDFIANDKVNSSYLTHVYSTDNSDILSSLLSNIDTTSILQDLYNSHINYLDHNGKDVSKFNSTKSPVNGFNYTLHDFIENIFIEDFRLALGITKVDFELKEGIPIEDKNILLLSTMYGGIRINKAVPLKYEFDINMSAIKMKYLMVCDKNDKLFIVPYTESNDDIPIGLYENLSAKQEKIIRDRLRKCINAYSKNNI